MVGVCFCEVKKWGIGKNLKIYPLKNLKSGELFFRQKLRIKRWGIFKKLVICKILKSKKWSRIF
jgi:hypothetical protein